MNLAMAYDDSTIYRCDENETRRLPILKVTAKRVYTEEWSGYAMFPRGVHGIGTRKVLALDRQKLEAGGYCRDGVRYCLHDPDRSAKDQPEV